MAVQTPLPSSNSTVFVSRLNITRHRKVTFVTEASTGEMRAATVTSSLGLGNSGVCVTDAMNGPGRLVDDSFALPGVGVTKKTACVMPGRKPYETSGNCGGNFGSNAAATVPSGHASERYLPPLESLKFVCSGAPGTRRSFPEAHTSR